MGSDLVSGTPFGSGASNVQSQSCSGSFNVAPSGAFNICQVSFTTTTPTTLQIAASGQLDHTGTALPHQLWVQVDSIGNPTFLQQYTPDNAPSSAALNASQAIPPGNHTVKLIYFTQTTGLLNSDIGSEQMTVSYVQ